MTENLNATPGQFDWIPFYEECADKLLRFKNDRTELVDALLDIASTVGGMSHLHETYTDGTSGPIRDICPFTTMGVFNRGITLTRRKEIAAAVGTYLGVEATPPVSFDSIPILNNMKSLFFTFEKNRGEGDIDAMWNVFDLALSLSQENDGASRSLFVNAFNRAVRNRGVRFNLTMGLYWIRPHHYVPLDKASRDYLQTIMKIKTRGSGPSKTLTGKEYLDLRDSLQQTMSADGALLHSFPELSLAAWIAVKESPSETEDDAAMDSLSEEGSVSLFEADASQVSPPTVPYTIDSIVEDGCFLPREDVEQALDLLFEKKNLILQGPPGTGKTWLARRLAYALIGRKSAENVTSVQFHPNMSYEDFVQGFRPSGGGRLELVDGPFLAMVERAMHQPDTPHVMVIEEINRGNPAHIFGELLTLIEPSKRQPDDAMTLTYQDSSAAPLYIPENVFIIGTMNVADRSLALVDYALRRRFAFISLQPLFNNAWHTWCERESGVSSAALEEVASRMEKLNAAISSHHSLGPEFQVGHSFVTPHTSQQGIAGELWFGQVVETELLPLLEEYWFDDPQAVAQAKQILLASW